MVSLDNAACSVVLDLHVMWMLVLGRPSLNSDSSKWRNFKESETKRNECERKPRALQVLVTMFIHKSLLANLSHHYPTS